MGRPRISPAYAFYYGVLVTPYFQAQSQRAAFPFHIPDRDAIAICVAYAGIGFTPIAALALTIGGLWPLSAGVEILVLPAIIGAIVLGVLFPRYGKYAGEGLVAGLAAVLVCDLVRWTFIAFGWWGDFIPAIGGWLNGTGQPNWILGYGFRWLGDGGGMGLTFTVIARTCLPGLTRRATVVLGIAYGLTIWLCLIVTLVAAPEAQTLLFPLTATTLILSCIGHVVYGSVLGALQYTTSRAEGWQPERGFALPRREAAGRRLLAKLEINQLGGATASMSESS